MQPAEADVALQPGGAGMGMSAQPAMKVENGSFLAPGRPMGHQAAPPTVGGSAGHSQETFVHRAAAHVGGQYVQEPNGGGVMFSQQAPQYSTALSVNFEHGRMGNGRQQDMFADPNDPASEVVSRMNDVRLSNHPQGNRGDLHMQGQQQMPVGMQGDMMRLQRPEMVAQPQDQNGQMKMNPYMGSVYIHGQMHYVQAQPGHLPFSGMPGNYGVPVQGMYSMADNGSQASKHNKYCHFCQHVKVRASGMLACCNKDCTRRFCEHCLSKSIGDDVNPQTSTAWESGQWHCPVCRKLCCCAIGECPKSHRHCKAYRYRVRRAEQASKRASGAPCEARSECSLVEGQSGQSLTAQVCGQSLTAAAQVKPEEQPSAGADAVKPKASEALSAALPPKVQVLNAGPSGHMSPARAPLLSPKLPSEATSPRSASRIQKPPGFPTDQNFDFQDPNSGPDSWLELFQDCDDANYIFQEENQSGRSSDISRQQSSTGAMPRNSSKDNFGLPQSTSTDSFSKLLGGEGMVQSMSYENLATGAAMGMIYSGSSDSLSLLQNMSHNFSSDSLQGLLPRSFSNSSLQAVLEASEGFTGGDMIEHGGPLMQPGMASGEMDGFKTDSAMDLTSSPVAARLNMRSYGRFMNMAGPGFSANYDVVSEGLQAAQSQEQMVLSASTGKRMQRTSSHNSLVREATRGQEGMIRPPSYEKLSRACHLNPDIPGTYSQPSSLDPVLVDKPLADAQPRCDSAT